MEKQILWEGANVKESLVFRICRGLSDFFQVWVGAGAPRLLYLGPLLSVSGFGLPLLQHESTFVEG